MEKKRKNEKQQAKEGETHVPGACGWVQQDIHQKPCYLLLWRAKAALVLKIVSWLSFVPLI